MRDSALVLFALGLEEAENLLPAHRRVLDLCFGGREMDTLYAFSGDKIWKRKVKLHVTGAFTPWTPVNGTPL